MCADDAIEAVARATVGTWPDLVEGTRASRPKAWGALAGHGVVALRERLGRAPSDAERRRLWAALWRIAHAPLR
jgi:hypothetical protein